MEGVAKAIMSTSSSASDMDNGVAREEYREFAIEVRGAHKGYGALRVLKGLDMSVPGGHM